MSAVYNYVWILLLSTEPFKNESHLPFFNHLSRLLSITAECTAETFMYVNKKNNITIKFLCEMNQLNYLK